MDSSKVALILGSRADPSVTAHFRVVWRQTCSVKFLHPSPVWETTGADFGGRKETMETRCVVVMMGDCSSGANFQQ